LEYGCVWNGQLGQFEEHCEKCVFVKLAPYLRLQQQQLNRLKDDNQQLTQKLSHTQTQLEELRQQFDSLHTVHNSSQQTDFSQLNSDNAVIKNDLKCLTDYLSTLEMRPPFLTLINENHRLREEVQLLNMKYHGLSMKLEVLLERNEVKSSVVDHRKSSDSTVDQVAKVLSASAKLMGVKHRKPERKLENNVPYTSFNSCKDNKQQATKL
jgi:septal ring factor EnvC (AmiA/AmiB activator)